MSTLPQAEQAGDTAEHLQVAREGRVLRITFNRPAARNAFTVAMYERLAETVRNLRTEHPDVRVLLLTGAGDKAFASGTDIAEFQAFRGAEDAIGYERRISRILDVLEASPVPTLAAIAGACTGGGLAIAACCDVRVAAANARFGVPIARTLGNCLSLTSHQRLAQLVGPGRVKDLIITARLLGAQEAMAWGLVSEVVPDAAALQQRASELAQAIAEHAPLTMQVTRESLAALVKPVDPAKEEELMLKAYLSDDFAEGVAAFLAKRPARWSGR